MRLFIQYEKDNQTGKGKFFRRIVPYLEAMGVKCFYENNRCDITIAPIRFREKTFGMPRVLRVDGIHILDTKKNRAKNEYIKDDIKKAHVVIWQSEFSKYMATGTLGVKARREAVIFNGANVVPRRPMNDGWFRIILSAKWISDGESRPHKRLFDMVDMLKEYVSTREKVACFVAGKTYLQSAPGITVLGHIDEHHLNKYLSISDVMLNLCWYDWCPNAVVEAICAGVPVVCGNNGGVPEIVMDSGIVLNLDTPMAPGYVNPEVPSIVDKKRAVFDALDEIRAGRRLNLSRPDLTAKYAATMYKDVFEGVLNARIH